MGILLIYLTIVSAKYGLILPKGKFKKPIVGWKRGAELRLNALLTLDRPE